jgi:hypothetical protein
MRHFDDRSNEGEKSVWAAMARARPRKQVVPPNRKEGVLTFCNLIIDSMHMKRLLGSPRPPGGWVSIPETWPDCVLANQ